MSIGLLAANQTGSAVYDDEQNLYVAPKMKFNPANKTLLDRVCGLNFSVGAAAILPSFETPYFGTGTKDEENSLVENELWHSTGFYQWIKLPSMGDYEDLEELNDVEAIDNVLYRESKKFSW